MTTPANQPSVIDKTQWSSSFIISRVTRFTQGESSPKELWKIEWEGKNKISIQVESGIELATLLQAIGNGDINTKPESMEEFLHRGGVVTKLPSRFAAGAIHQQAKGIKPLPPVKVEPKLKKQAALLSAEELLNLLMGLE